MTFYCNVQCHGATLLLLTKTMTLNNTVIVQNNSFDESFCKPKHSAVISVHVYPYIPHPTPTKLLHDPIGQL